MAAPCSIEESRLPLPNPRLFYILGALDLARFRLALVYQDLANQIGYAGGHRLALNPVCCSLVPFQFRANIMRSHVQLRRFIVISMDLCSHHHL